MPTTPTALSFPTCALLIQGPAGPTPHPPQQPKASPHLVEGSAVPEDLGSSLGSWHEHQVGLGLRTLLHLSRLCVCRQVTSPLWASASSSAEQGKSRHTSQGQPQRDAAAFSVLAHSSPGPAGWPWSLPDHIQEQRPGRVPHGSGSKGSGARSFTAYPASPLIIVQASLRSHVLLCGGEVGF